MERQALGQLLSPPRKSQTTVITLVVEAISGLRETFLAQKTGAAVPSALVRSYRPLHNRRVEHLVLSRQMIRTLAKKTHALLVATDWTEWHPPYGCCWLLW